MGTCELSLNGVGPAPTDFNGALPLDFADPLTTSIE